MKTIPLAAGLLALLAPSPAEELVFSVEPETSLARTFESRAEGALVRRTFSADGELVREVGEDELEGLFSFRSLERIAVTDEILEVEDGRATDLRRTFDELLQENRQVLGEDELDITSGSDLEGETVRFLWDDDVEAFDVEWDDPDTDLDGDLLAHLTDDLDLRALLPEGDAEEGDEWEVDAAGYLPLMWPSGLLGFYDEGEAGIDEATRARNVQVVENLEGEGTATLEAFEDVDGVRVARIAVELSVSSSIEEEVEPDEGPAYTETTELERELTGTLLWDLDHGHLFSAEFEAEFEMVQTSAFEAETQEGDLVEIEDARTFEGTISYTVEVERE